MERDWKTKSSRIDERNEKQLLWNDRRNEISTVLHSSDCSRNVSSLYGTCYNPIRIVSRLQTRKSDVENVLKSDESGVRATNVEIYIRFFFFFYLIIWIFRILEKFQVRIFHETDIERVPNGFAVVPSIVKFGRLHCIQVAWNCQSLRVSKL